MPNKTQDVPLTNRTRVAAALSCRVFATIRPLIAKSRMACDVSIPTFQPSVLALASALALSTSALALSTLASALSTSALASLTSALASLTSALALSSLASVMSTLAFVLPWAFLGFVFVALPLLIGGLTMLEVEPRAKMK
jgi:uncharacterized membrane protein YfhO